MSLHAIKPRPAWRRTAMELVWEVVLRMCVYTAVGIISAVMWGYFHTQPMVCQQIPTEVAGEWVVWC